jgi:hypothetical protein
MIAVLATIGNREQQQDHPSAYPGQAPDASKPCKIDKPEQVDWFRPDPGGV